MEKQLITRIVRDSILDGPGCRYVVFVKGCNLRCTWCHNPETQHVCQETMIYDKFCIHCGNCLKALPKELSSNLSSEKMDPKKAPLKMEDPTDPRYFPCVEACPTDALVFAGKEYSTEWLLDDMTKFKTIYMNTGGGLTISGGEPLLTNAFSKELLTKAKAAGFHTAVDTSGTLPWSVIEEFLPLVDIWLYDLKHLDDPEVKSDLAVENLRKLSSISANIQIRIPLIPGYNDSPALLERMAKLIAELGDNVKGLDLLPFHPFADSKYIALRRDYQHSGMLELEEDSMEKIKDIFLKHLPENILNLGRKMFAG